MKEASSQSAQGNAESGCCKQYLVPDSNSVSENSAADTMPTPVALTVPKQDLVNIVFTWNFGGQEAYLVGSFTGWTERLLMKKVGGNEFSLLHPLERGVH